MFYAIKIVPAMNYWDSEDAKTHNQEIHETDYKFHEA